MFHPAAVVRQAGEDPEGHPALRHNKDACNILFVDGHAATTVLKTYDKVRHLKEYSNVYYKSWPTEFINGGNQLYITSQTDNDPGKTAEDFGWQRNPDMPLIWSIPGKLYR